MIKGIIENTHTISSKITKFIWFLDYRNFFKINMYFETEGVLSCNTLISIIILYHIINISCLDLPIYYFYNLYIVIINVKLLHVIFTSYFGVGVYLKSYCNYIV